MPAACSAADVAASWQVLCSLAELAHLQPAAVFDGMFEGPRHSLLGILAILEPPDFESCRALVDLLTSLKYAEPNMCIPIETACPRCPTRDWPTIIPGMLRELQCLGGARVPLRMLTATGGPSIHRAAVRLSEIIVLCGWNLELAAVVAQTCEPTGCVTRPRAVEHLDSLD